MANYASLKALIDAYITTNGQNSITGAILNTILNDIVSSLGSGYQFAGVATPATNPGNPDPKVFYFAMQAGIYTNFNSLQVAKGLAILKFDTAWSLNQIFTVDDSVTQGSQALIISDAVYQALQNLAVKNIPADWSPLYNTDLSFVDENGYSIVDFMNGHVHTKNFNSADAPKIVNPSEGSLDFGISDANENAIAVFENGHFRTKNFNSARLINTDYFWNLLNRYKGKRISILGDSISTWGDPDSRNQLGTYCYSYYPTETCRYSKNGNVTISGVTYQSIKMAVKDTWWMHLITNLGAVLGCNESYRGTLVTGSGSTTFNNQTRINHLGSNGTPDVILVFGGTNDAGNSATLGTFNGGVYSDYDTAAKIAALDVSTFANAYKAMLIRLMYTYPDAEIVCILPTFTTSYYTIASLDAYVEVIKEACDFFGIRWIDIRVSGINIYNKNSYLVDGIHPNAKGMALLSKTIFKQLIFS